MAMSLHTKRVVVFMLGLALCVALILVADQERRRHTPQGRPAPIVTAENAACVDCHGQHELTEGKSNTLGAVAQWRNSRHAEKGVGCLDCHRGYDVADDGTKVPHADSWLHRDVLISNIVTPKDCQSCHPKETLENMASHHSSAAMFIGSLDNVLGEIVTGAPNAVLGCKQCHGSRIRMTKTFADGSTFALDMNAISQQAQDTVEAEFDKKKQPIRFKKALSAEMDRLVAVAFEPHRDKALKPERAGLSIDRTTWPNSGIGRFNPDGSMGSCNACHSRHSFSKALARQPENCGKCHMGPDHPQIEIYSESKHGIAFRNRLSEMNLDGDPNTGEWIVGKQYSAAPTCATCHMSAAPGVPASHDPGLRISWTLRPVVSTQPASIGATINADGQEVVRTYKPEAKRNTMQRVCSVCHGPTHIENFYKQYDDLVWLYNLKFAEPAKKLMGMLWKKGYLDKATPFGTKLDWVYFELWHHEGRRMRMGASMMGPDYTHWHGSYEVAQHFYMKFLPEVEKIAKEKNDQDLLNEIKKLMKTDYHIWKQGLSPEKRREIQRFYEERYKQGAAAAGGE